MGKIFKTKKLTTLAEALILVFGLAIVLGGVYYFSDNIKRGESIMSNITGDKPDLILAYNTFPGMMGILYMNNGMEPNEDSELFKRYGLKLKIVQMDEVKDTRDGLATGSLDVVYCTTDALPVEMSNDGTLVNLGVKQFMKVNESRGADAVVAMSYINSVADLKGKKVAYAVGTASNTLLINLLETNNLSINDIESYKVGNGIEAATAFKNGQCDAALVWAPDDEDCVAAVKNSKILVTTETATQIISDGLLATSETIKEKRDLLISLVKAWTDGNAIIANDQSAMAKANELFSKGFNFPVDLVAATSHKIRYSTIGDNKQFFGLDATFSGVTGEKMYSRMAVKYSESNLAKSPVAWRIASTSDIIEGVLTDQTFCNKPEQSAESAVSFNKPTQAEATKQASGSKQVILNFAHDSFILSEENKAIIDRDIVGVAQAFANARIRVEGNTDNTGNYNYNVTLSQKRANAVVDYLVREYKFDSNKFVVVGNGPSKPVVGCESNSTEECRSKNRRTEFQFIW